MATLPMIIKIDPDDPELAELFVDGEIDGRPYRLLLDTGAAQSRVLADEHLSTLEVLGHKESNGAFDTRLTDELVRLGRFTVGPIDKADLIVVRVSASNRQSLVGMDMLGDMALGLDFDRAEVRFAPSGSRPAGFPLLRSPRGHPFLELDFGGASGLACWDTGAAITLAHTGFVAEHAELFTPVGTSTGTDSTGTSAETATYRMAAATVGGITIAAQTVAAVPLPQEGMRMDLILGYPALRRFNWTMDFPVNRWDATPVTSSQDPPLSAG